MLIKFNEENKQLATAIGSALVAYGTDAHLSIAPAGSVITKGEDHSTDAGSVDPHTAGVEASTDDKLVAFNESFCGKSEIPFYQSGKTKGQWKKKKGVSQGDYDSWYREQLSNLSEPGGPLDDIAIDTTAAFGGGQVQQTTQQRQSFSDAGQFMAWVSEQQTAQLLTQADIDSAYQTANVAIQDLFNATTAAGAIAAVYDVLARIAEGQS